MFQLAFGLGTDTWEPGIVGNALRWLCSLIDTVVYQLIVLVYQILFTIADSSILSSQFIKDFYGRFQLIIGVFMIFKLSVSVLQAVINPDILTDQKNGMGKIITRIITMLLMFTAIIPLNIPNATPGSYNAYLNQHGLLFGTMYSLQARILDQGTIEKLMLGNVDSANSEDTEDVDAKSGIDKKKSANRMASYMLKAFVSINMKENATSEGDENEDNYICPVSKIDDKDDKNVYEIYKTDDTSPMDILKYINTTCGYDGAGDGFFGQPGKYALAYFPIVPTICGGIVLYVLLGFCIDVAIRSIKLAVLRLIAPIPIMSYINPKSSENGAFANWTKLIISTFLNLFIILAIIFFAIDIVARIADKDQSVISLPITDQFSIVNIIATVFIIVGVFLFAKQAPKFIMDALGIKGMGLGAGLSGVLGSVGALMGGGGLAGAASGFIGAANDASNAAAQGKQAPPAYSTQRANIAKMITGDDKNDGSMAYRMQKAFHDRAGARAFNRLYGINGDSTLAAKNKMYALQDDATRAKNAYESFVKGSKSDIARALGYDYDEQNGIMMDQNGNIVDDNTYVTARNNMAQNLEESYINAEASAGKAKADFEKMQKIAERANVIMTPEQEHLASREERRQYRRDNSLIRGGYQAVRNGISTGRATGSFVQGVVAAQGTMDVTREDRSRNRPIGQTRDQRRNGDNTFQVDDQYYN